VKRFLRWCAYLVLSFLVLVAALYLGHGLNGRAEVRAAQQQATADLAAALPDGERQATEDRDRARNLGSRGTPTYAWQEVVCQLNTREGGWIVQDYVQECEVRSVDLYPTTGPDSGSCEYQPPPLDEAASTSGTPLIVSIDRGPASGFESDEPWARSCPDWVLTPAHAQSSRLLTGRRPADLSTSPAWVVVSTHTPVSNTSLGCSPWDLLFCSAPVDHPVLDDAES
jgi:hypothetical protein